jgi:hypothetical protein
LKTFSPLTISGNNRRLGLTYIFIIDFVLVGLLAIGYLLSRQPEFTSLWQSETIFRLSLIISLSLSFSIHTIIHIWRAILAFRSKTIVFGPQKIQFLINERLIWESDYPHLNRIEVDQINQIGQSLIQRICVIISTPKGEEKKYIGSHELSQEYLKKIIEAFRTRQIRIVEK